MPIGKAFGRVLATAIVLVIALWSVGPSHAQTTDSIGLSMAAFKLRTAQDLVDLCTLAGR